MQNYFIIKTQKDFDKSKSQIAKLILSGKIGIFPTCTVYGIGVRLSDNDGYNKIYDIKTRTKDKQLPAVIGSFDQLYKIVNKNTITDQVKVLISKFWPGPLSIVFKLDTDKSIAIRYSEHQILSELLTIVNEPIALTSANLSGDQSPVKISSLSDELIQKVDFIIDTGATKYKNESTIVDWNGNILREGVIKEFEIKKELYEKNCKYKKNS